MDLDEKTQQQENNFDKISPINEIQEVSLVDSFSYEPNNLVWSRCVHYSKTQFSIGLEQGQIILIDIAKKETKKLELKDAPHHKVKDIAFLNKNSLMIACYFDEFIHVWDLKEENVLLQILPYISYNCAIIKDRYVAIPSALNTNLNQILILDSKKKFKEVSKISIPLQYDQFKLNYVRFINSFHPCSNILTFVDERYLYIYDFFTKHYISVFSLRKYGYPYKVKTYRKNHFYYVLILFTSNRFIIFDAIKGNLKLKYAIKDNENDQTIQCCEFIDPYNIIMGFSEKYAYIINIETKKRTQIKNEQGFVGSFIHKNMLYTTADKSNQIYVYQLN